MAGSAGSRGKGFKEALAAAGVSVARDTAPPPASRPSTATVASSGARRTRRRLGVESVGIDCSVCSSDTADCRGVSSWPGIYITEVAAAFRLHDIYYTSSMFLR